MRRKSGEEIKFTKFTAKFRGNNVIQTESWWYVSVSVVEWVPMKFIFNIDYNKDDSFNVIFPTPNGYIKLIRVSYNFVDVFESKYKGDKIKIVTDATGWRTDLKDEIASWGFEIVDDSKLTAYKWDDGNLLDPDADGPLTTDYVWYKKHESSEDLIKVKALDNATFTGYDDEIVPGKEYWIKVNGMYFLRKQYYLYADLSLVGIEIDENGDETYNESDLENARNDAEAESERYEGITSAFEVDGTDRGNVVFNDVLTDINYYKPGDQITGTEKDTVEEISSFFLTTITDIGMVIAILMCAIIGIKYMLGSVEEKAEYKKDMIPYLVGAMLLFGITAFVKVISGFADKINTSI